MGLLSNQHQRDRLVMFLHNHNKKLAALMYLIGLGWFLALAYQPLNAGTYFSENALLPGLVESDLPQKLSKAFELKEELKAVMSKDKKVSPHDWIFNKFKAMGLDTYRHNFSVHYPFKSISNKVVYGENVWAIMRARRSASFECLVLSVPLRPLAMKEKTPTAGGTVLSLALAELFKRKAYWAKDIIFLFTEYDEIGTMAWLDAYHGTSSSEYIVSETLMDGRGGQIQAAINLELPLEKVSYYNLKLEGLNGQLPNLDLVNLVIKLCRSERSRVTLHHTMEEKNRGYYDGKGESFEEFKTALLGMTRMMWSQASGAPSGNHGIFHRYLIQALTVEGIKSKKGTRVNDLTSSGRIIEGTFRSLNNLLERLHQSFFFYVLPATNRYVSIGMYMPPFALMVCAGLIPGISLWINLPSKPTDKDEKLKDRELSEDEKKDGEKGEEASKDKENTQTTVDGQADHSTEAPGDGSQGAEGDSKVAEDDSKEEGDGTAQPGLDLEDEDDMLEYVHNSGMITVLPVILISLLLGWLAYQGPDLLTRVMPRFRIRAEDMVIYTMLAVYTAALMYPKLMIRKSSSPNRLVLDWRLLKAIALQCQSLALACVSTCNISQAFFLAAFMVPVTTMVQPTKYRLLRWLQMSALVLVSPFALMFLIGFVTAWPQPDLLSFVTAGFSSTKELIFLGIMDSYLFNTWSYSVMTAVIFPVWLLFWTIPWAEPEEL